MRIEERYAHILDWFRQHMPSAESELRYDNPYQLLVAVILSAQCTDKRVNMTTPALFDRFPTPQHMAEADPEEIYPYIKSISYPNNKAKNLSGMARMLVSEFGGQVPSDIDQLQRLPGVGRKTANLSRPCPSTRTYSAYRTGWDSPPARKRRCRPKCSSRHEYPPRTCLRPTTG